MLLHLTLLAAAFVLGLVLTPLVRALARRVGLVDRPDKRRKIHVAAVPVAGGIAVFLSGTLVLTGAMLFSEPFRLAAEHATPGLLPLLLGCVILLFIGVLDDAHSLNGRHKLIGQVVAVSVIMGCGFVVHKIRLFGLDVDLGVLAVPFTAFWLLGGINSLNLIDGMDGLLGTVGSFICAALGAIALLRGQETTAATAFVLLGTLLAFLVYNFPPATIFLGDAGSMLVGLLAAVLSVQVTMEPSPTTWIPAGALAILALPIFDTLAAIVRRSLTGRSIFCSDRGHLHHHLLRRGLTPRSALFVVSVLSLSTALGAIAALVFEQELVAFLTPLVLAIVLVETRLFGYAEVVLVSKQLRAVAIRAWMGRMKGKVQRMEVRLQGSMAWEDLWEKLVRCGHDLDLVSICLDVNAPAIHEGYFARWESFGHPPMENGGGWQADVPLEAWGPVVGRVVMRGPQHDQEFWHKIAVVARVIQEFETPGLPAPTVLPPSLGVVAAVHRPAGELAAVE